MFLARIKANVSPQEGNINRLMVRVCAAHMGGFLGPKFSQQISL